MEKLTKNEAIQKHRDMWNWIAEQIEQSNSVMDIEILKYMYVAKKGINIHGNCFLCEHAKLNREDIYCGGACILKWKNRCCTRSEYFECCNAITQQEQHELALKIANLEERKFDDESV